ncbi:conserved hypothetical protein [Aspergillus terreus NIH2624]|uniref:Signal peptidase complex subunit 1 n=1 Tax=Aspergillus terreus (strain NIH 2624 / FGSC A1156) TaxID=341663 RepID=Q0CA32_ASPTN|nr:uncharacterized protein ATEG_09452 [Aspergillus terreus NIH2624]EAU30589.1 conserved hypothetical protein [Aspergillus terreus NIH2624]
MDDILAPIQDAFEGQIVSFLSASQTSSHLYLLLHLAAWNDANLPIRSSEQDFHGQRIAELLSTALLIISGVVAFFVGYIYQDIHLTLWVGLGGTLITGLAVIPPWPMYNKNPEKWLVPVPGSAGGAGVVVDGVKVA